MVTKKKLTPASICAQKKWSSFPLGLKKELRKTIKDADRDGVPNGFDCKPKNRRKQEGFTLSADAYLESHKRNIKLGKKLGEGMFGQVYEVDNEDGNNDFVIKVPGQMVNAAAYEIPESERKQYARSDIAELRREATNYKKFGGKKDPMIIPTKIVKVNICGVNTIGLVRPKVIPIRDNSRRVSQSDKLKMTDSKLRVLYNDLIKLTRKGYAFNDGLQLGLDKSGKSLVYDLGDITKYPPSSDEPYRVNNYMWQCFLDNLDKTDSYRNRFPEITRY